jgi:tripartite-type tricarboxylate transporter receptor subunit TctC
VTDPSFDRGFLEPNFYAPLAGSPEEFVQYVRTEEARWGRVIVNAKLSLD